MIIKVQYNCDITQDCNLYHINFPVMILRMVTP